MIPSHLTSPLIDPQLSGEERELFPTGKSGDPNIVHLGDERLALLRDQQTIFIDRDGNPTQKLAVTWTKVPHALREW